MKFRTGSNTERTQKYVRVKVQNDIRMSTHIHKQLISPIFNCVTPVSVSLARQQQQQKYDTIINLFFIEYFLADMSGISSNKPTTLFLRVGISLWPVHSLASYCLQSHCCACLTSFSVFSRLVVSNWRDVSSTVSDSQRAGLTLRQ